MHVAAIMDGNRRWAKINNLPIREGYIQAIKSLRNIIDYSLDSKIVESLTVFAFSTENNKRPESEKTIVFEILFDFVFSKEIENFINKGCRFSFIGDISILDKKIQEKVYKIIDKSKNNNKLNVCIAFNYSGKDDLVSCFQKLLNSEKKNISKENIDSELMTSQAGIKDPDLLIRTGGEKRISNFMLWQISYTELYFSDKMWPEFSVEDFIVAIKDYNSRSRRIGV